MRANRGWWRAPVPATVLVTVLATVLGLVLTWPSRAATVGLWRPVYRANFPDPTALYYAGRYYAFASQTDSAIITSAVSADGIHWKPSAVAAMPKVPSWVLRATPVADNGKTWAPSVTYDRTTQHFVMFYAALDDEYSPPEHCIGMAVSDRPAGPYRDHSTAPFLCQPSLGGTIDPNVYINPATGKAFLYVKNAGDWVDQPDAIWVQRLTFAFEPSGPLTQLLALDQPTWQGRTIEGPTMAKFDHTFFLLYAGNTYTTSRYAIGYAKCRTPYGPCFDDQRNPLIATTGSMRGPGSPAVYRTRYGRQKIVFAAWFRRVHSIRAMYEATISAPHGWLRVTATR
jgi:beta-xylosidase